MDLKVIEKEKDKLIIELKGEKHTISALLCWALQRDSKVTSAVYVLDHPEVGTPRLTIRTKGESAASAFSRAVELIEKELKSLRTAANKL